MRKKRGNVQRSWKWSIMGALAALGLPLLASGGGQSSEAADPIAARWGVPPFFNDVEPQEIPIAWSKRLTGYLETRDGTRLRYSVLLPKGKGPFPAIINYSGYDPGAIGGSAYRHNDMAMSTSLDRTLLEHGYAVLGVNARGTGCSEGRFDFLARSYGTDGADIVEWSARQAWSNGSIATANWSWAGMSQLATAAEQPPHLKAIVPGMALTDPRSDSWAIGGVPSQGFITGWWMFLHSRWLTVRRSAEAEHDTACVTQADKNYENAEKPDQNLPTLLIRHPLRDAWIDERTILPRMDRIRVPVLSMEAFQDEATTARAGYYHDRLNPQQLWLIQTNGNHDLYESLEFRKILVAYLDHFVKGIENGFQKRPHVEIWQETDSSTTDRHPAMESAKPRWRIPRNEFPVPVDTWTLSLGPHQTLTSDAASGTPDEYAYPIEGPTIDIEPGPGAWGALSPRWREGSVAYTSAPLERDVLIYGPVSADLWISSSANDTDLQVTLTEVSPNGDERYIQRGWLRMSDRALDATRSTDHLPILCDRPECIQALVPNRPALGRVELTKVSHPLRKGSRVRIWIDAPSATGENSFDHASLPSKNQIWHDADHPSRVVFGTLPDVETPPGSAGCGHVLMQPCRADPLAH
jgi:putative CocE/NonD family hydrolase